MNKTIRFIVVAATLTLLPSILNAQPPDTLRTYRYNNPFHNELSRSCAVDSAGNLYVSGYSDNDYLTVKFAAATGDTVWAEKYNGPANSNDIATGCVVDEFGYLYVTGCSSNGVNDDCLTIKYNTTTGDTIWTRRYNGPENGYDGANCCALDGNGNLYVSGYTSSISTKSDYLTIKYDVVTGDTIWVRFYNGPGNWNDAAYACAVDNAGNLYVTGSADNIANTDCITIKYDANTGDTIWTRFYNGPSNSTDESRGCAADGAGYLYVTGFSNNNTNNDYISIKYDTNTGDTVWTSRFCGPSDYDDEARSCAVDGAGDLYVTGCSNNSTIYNYPTIKYYGSTGDTAWTFNFTNSLVIGEEASACLVDLSGNLFVTGHAYYLGTGSVDFLTVKYNTATGVAGKPELPMTVSKLRLEQNKPNPFNQHTTISYQLPTSGPASLKIYNAAGQLVKSFDMGQQQPGHHQVEWRDSKITAGVYFYRLTAGNYQATKKLVVVK